ncbi:hypothetical protein [Clostridium sp. CCUG 7971]|uniref:hypothetical protein n=1 Tax=Clostridium sp. CCUG 7971 TaxID=2811414 RepID=UPI001ABB33A2|nr:hypothetical protein [Clostridium sp. CCUG 7971]MBO3444374.1 hypothetical protein [Clostridium sp. CCUG 7971]
MNTDRTMWAMMCGIILLQIIDGLVCLWFGKSLSLKHELSVEDGKIFKKYDIREIRKKYSKILKNIGIINITLGILSPIIAEILSIFIKSTSVPMIAIAIVILSILATIMYIVISLIITIININIKIGYKVLLLAIIILWAILQFVRPELIKMIIK